MGTSIEGMPEVLAYLDSVIGRLRDPSPAMRREADALDAMVDQSFASERSPDGTPWPPRKTTTSTRGRNPRARATRRGRPGGLRESSGARLEGQSIVVDATKPYAGYVQKTRAFLPFDPETLEPMTNGPAGVFFEGMEGRLGDWIVRGENGR